MSSGTSRFSAEPLRPGACILPARRVRAALAQAGSAVRYVAPALLLAVLSATLATPAQAQTELWSATLTIGEPLETGGPEGYCSATCGSNRHNDYGSLSTTTFDLDSTTYTVESVRYGTGTSSVNSLFFEFSPIYEGEVANLQLEIGTTSHDLSAAGRSTSGTLSKFVWGDLPIATSRPWPEPTTGSTVTVKLIETASSSNIPATGAPTISGMAQVGETLTAATTGIMDADGLTSPTYTYQWLRVEADAMSNLTEISGATSGTYTLGAAEAGKKIKVQASFQDDDGNLEELTSAAYPSGTETVAPAVSDRPPGSPLWSATLTVGTRTDHLSNIFYGYYAPETVGTILPYGSLSPDTFIRSTATVVVRSLDYVSNRDDGALSFSFDLSVGTTPPDGLLGHNVAYVLTLGSETFTFTADRQVSANRWIKDGGIPLAWNVGDTVQVSLALATNTPATGAPTISGTAQVGGTLTAATTGIADAEGLTSPTYTYQWLRVEADAMSNLTEISGATSGTYTLGAAEAGKKIKVQVSFQDDEGNDEELTSDAYPSGTETVAPAPAQNSAPSITSPSTFSAVEGNTAVATLTATDADSDPLTWALAAAPGADGARFSLSDSGELAFVVAPDYEHPDDDDADRVYEVNVAVTDAVVTTTQNLMVTVTDVAPGLTGPATASHAEGKRGVRIAAYTVNDDVAWSLTGADSALFTIAAGFLRSVDPPDFENAADANTDNVYNVTVEAGDGTATETAAVAVTVTDVDEPGTVTLSLLKPTLNTALAATLTDPDTVSGTPTWQWERANGREGWETIDGATAASYTPTAADADRYLRATATYTDGLGAGKTAQAIAPHVVIAHRLSALTVPGLSGVPSDDRAFYPTFDPDTLHYAARCTESVTLTLTSEDDDTRLSVNGVQRPKGEAFTVDALGRESDIRITLTGSEGASTTYTVHCIDREQFPKLTTVKADGATEDLMMFRAKWFPSGVGWRSSLIMMDNNGVPRLRKWIDDQVFEYFRVFPDETHPRARYAFTKQGTSYDPDGVELVALDKYFNTVDDDIHVLSPFNNTDGHDHMILPNGDYVLMAYSRQRRDLRFLRTAFPELQDSGGGLLGTEAVMDSAIQVRTADGTVKLNWNSWDHMAIEDCVLGSTFHDEYGHINALGLIDGDIIAGFRGCSKILRIDMDTGDVVWRAGPSILSREQWEAGETLQPDRGPAPLDFVNDPRGGFSGQHGGQMTVDGNLLVYDNATHCEVPPGVPEDAKGLTECDERTRAVEYAIDIPNEELVFQREFLMPETDPPKTVGGFAGHAEPLDNGDWVISWSNTIQSDPRAPMPNTAMHVDALTGAEKLSMTLENIIGTRGVGAPHHTRVVMVSPVALAARVEPLEAAIVSRAEFHSGTADRPTVVVAFNGPVVDFDPTTPSLNVAGATVSSVSPHVVAGEAANAYVVTLTPAGTDDITVGLAADQPCADGGICTVDGTVLSEVPAIHVIRADTTPPAVSKIEITSNPGSDRFYIPGDEIQATVTFSETVAVTGMPQLMLELGGSLRTANYQGGSGTAALVFTYEVADGESDDDGVGVEADSLSGGTIRDAARNNAELGHDGLPADARHKVDGVKPDLVASGGAVVNGTTLTLTYDESLDRSSTPASEDFTVSGGDKVRRVSRVSVSGSTVVLTLDTGAEHLEAGIQVSYTRGTNPIRDVSSNQAEALNRESVTNETPDTTPPTVESLEISSNAGADRTYAAGDEIEVTVTFSETVEVEGTPQLSLRVGSRNRTASYRGGTDTDTLTFVYEVADGDEDTDGVSVDAGRIALNGGTIEDEAENSAELAHEAVEAQTGHKVDGVRPAFVSAAVDGSSLTLTYGEALDGGSRPTSGNFTVEVGGSGRSVSGVAVSESVVTLTLNPAVEHGDTGIRVSYSPGTDPIRDAVGNDARGLSNQAVTNTTGAQNTAPEITSVGPFNVGENQVLVRRLAARDTDPGDEVTGWEIVGGADRFQFSIVPDTGELSFQTAPDYEDPVDMASTDPVSGAGDNEYVVAVEVKSGSGARELEAEQTVIVRLTDEREPPEVPEAPTFSGETADSLTVSWSEPDNTGPPITDYDVQYREKDKGSFNPATHQGPGLTLTLTDLDPGTDYEVQVRARNEEGTSDWSEPGEGMTVTPLTVVMTSGTEPPVSGPFTVRFSFSEPVTGFSGSDIETGQDPACVDDQNNTVFCDPGIEGLDTADDRVFTTTVSPWTDRVAHSYTLTLTVPGGAVRSAVGSKPNEEPEERLEVRVAPPGVEEPISSIGLGASPGSGSVRLSWNRPSDNGGSAIIRYEYRYQAVGEAWSEWENVGAGSRGVTVGNLVNGREYVFEVRAVNALGKGGVETVQAVPERRIAPPPPPRPPGNGGGGGLLLVPEGPAGVMAMPGDGAVRLEWSPPESDGGTPILRYEYRLKEGRGEFGEWTPIEDSAPGEVNATGYVVGGLDNGTVYVFELRGVNLVGNGRVSEAVEAVMRLERAYWSNFLAEDLEGESLMLEAFFSGGSSGDRELRFGEALRFEEDALDGEGEVTATRSGGYGYRYTSRTTGELSLDYDGGEACELRLTFRGVGAGSYSYRCGGVLGGQGSFRLSGLNQAPEITSVGPFEVVENRTRVGQLEAVDPDEGDGIGGYGIAGGADGALFAVVEETGELLFREAPDYEDPSDVESAEPESGAADNEYIVVVEVRSGEGERERRGSRAIRVRVSDEEEPPEITSLGPFEVVENQTRVGRLEAVDPDEGDGIGGYAIAGGADGALFAVVEETGELQFREAPDYEAPADVESADPESGAGDNEYIVVVEVRSGEGERERRGSRAIRVRVSDEEEPPEITSVGPFEVVENRTRVGQLEAVDQDKQDEITEYGIAGGADGALFEVVEETGELLFREAPDYETPGDVASDEPQSGAGDNEYVVVVEVSSGEGERERKGSRAIRVRVSDEEEPPGAPGAPVVTAEGSDSLKVSWREPENRGPEIVDYDVRYREGGEEGYSDGGHEGTGLLETLTGLKEGTVYEVQVRAINEEGIGEWSEPGEGRTEREEADPDDPSDFTEEDLEGRRLTLQLEGEERSAGSIELRFGEDNRFEQIESGGEQAATKAEGGFRSGAYTYEKTGPGMGTVRLDYDDGASCEVRLSFTESGVGTYSYDCGDGDLAEGSFRLTTGSLFVPVILSSAGQNQSFFTSELTLTNRGKQEVQLDYIYTAERGGGSGRAEEVLGAGEQKIETDALTYLRRLGVPIPETGNRIGTLRVEVELGSEVQAVVRTATVVPEGRAGLAYLGVAEEEGFSEPVYLCGLRQNSQDRSNVAFQNMGAPEEGAIVLRTTVYSGAAANTTARVLEDVELEPGEFHQYSGLLGVLESVEGDRQGYVKVERVEGMAAFYAYGVINDQANSDGSFIFPVTASSLEGRMGQTLPVIVETSNFTSELTVTNFSDEARRLDFQFVAEGIEADDKTAGFSMTLEAGQQEIVADVVEELRRQEVAGLGRGNRALAGPVFARAVEGDMSGVVIGARTGSEGGGGSYSVFYNAVPEGAAFSQEAWVDGLQQNQENRSNLALVNTGEVDGSPSVFHLEIYDGETGMLVETVVTKPIPARRWHQINGILGRASAETKQGYIRIEKVSGENPFLAYGVVNDGGAPGERSGDGAYVPARE